MSQNTTEVNALSLETVESAVIREMDYSSMSGYAAHALLTERASSLRKIGLELVKSILSQFELWASVFANNATISASNADTPGLTVTDSNVARIMTGQMKSQLVLLGRHAETKKDGGVKKPQFFTNPAQASAAVINLVGENEGVRAYYALRGCAHDVVRDADGKESSRMQTGFEILWKAVQKLVANNGTAFVEAGKLVESFSRANAVELDAAANAVMAGFYLNQARQATVLAEKLLALQKTKNGDKFEERRETEVKGNLARANNRKAAILESNEPVANA